MSKLTIVSEVIIIPSIESPSLIEYVSPDKFEPITSTTIFALLNPSMNLNVTLAVPGNE